MSQAEIDALQPVAERLARVVSKSAQDVLGDAIKGPSAGSRLDRANKANLRDAYDHAGQRMQSAQDHLRAISLLLMAGPLPIFALYTLLRAAAVAIVHGTHLLDPPIDEVARLARGLNARLENIENQGKVLADDAEDAGEDEHTVARVTHLTERATANRIEVLTTRAGRVNAFGERRLSDTRLFGKYLPAGTKAYRYLSGQAHSQPWAQLPRGTRDRTDDRVVGIQLAELSVPLFAALLTGVLDLYEETVRYWLGHAGYPIDVWTEVKKGPIDPAPTQ